MILIMIKKEDLSVYSDAAEEKRQLAKKRLKEASKRAAFLYVLENNQKKAAKQKPKKVRTQKGGHIFYHFPPAEQ